MSSVRIAGVRYRYAAARRRGAARDSAETTGIALDGVDLDLRVGTLSALLGPNGSGKSTLLRLVAGLDRPEAGMIEIDGEVAGTVAAAAAIGVVFQSPSLDPRLTVRENLRTHAVMHGLRGAEADAAIARHLDGAALAEHADRLVRTLSGGLARRVDLVRALLPGPRVLLLDEPTVGLDPAARTAFLDVVAEVARQDRVTVLLTTHLVDEAERADRVVLMHRGRIVVDGTPAALRAGLGRRVISVASAECPATADGEQRARWRRRAGEWTIEPVDEAETRRLLDDLLAAAAPVTVAPPTLADLFVRLTGDDLDVDAAQSAAAVGARG